MRVSGLYYEFLEEKHKISVGGFNSVYKCHFYCLD